MKKIIIILLPTIILIPINELQARYIPPRLVIRLLKAGIYSFENEISKIESKGIGAGTKKQALKKIEEEIEKIKEEHGIKKLEGEKTVLEKERDRISRNIYANTVINGTNLFRELNMMIEKIKNNPIIQDMVDEIIELKRKIAERSKKDVDKIQELGKQIDKVTQATQAELNGVKSKILPLDLEIKTKWLSIEVTKKRVPLTRQKIEVREELDKIIEKLPTQSKNRLQDLKNSISRIKLLLDYFRNPDKIQAATEAEVLGFM